MVPVERAGSDGPRLDIQGLRAVAVLLVVAFHAGLPVPGGFVGVDVFFVISGFVITGMIQRELAATGHFSFGRFYLRRFKRLTPALALMVAVTTVMSFCLLSPFGSQQIAAQTGIGAMLLAANFVIAKTTGGYFDAPAESNPLLHTWSLSVEEQFYLLFPAILLLGWVLTERGGRQRARVTVGTVALISFGLAMTGAARLTPSHSDWFLGFYSPFTRAWEFAVGALLALAAKSGPLRSRWLTHVFAWLGLALLAESAWMINSATPFPGLWTLLPVVGTLLLIAAGMNQNTHPNRALAHPVMVTIGDWSYSIYLWHWPLKVFAVQIWPEDSLAALAAVTLSVLPAAASYRWLEQPLRRLPRMSRPRTLALVAAVVSPSILIAATLGFAANAYWLPRYQSLIAHQGDTDWNEFLSYLDTTYYPCPAQAIRDGGLTWEGTTHCRQSKSTSRVDVAIIGDSHTLNLFPGLAEALPDKNVVYYDRNGRPGRSEFNRLIDDIASDGAISTVLVTAQWVDRGVRKDELVQILKAFRSGDKADFVNDDIPIFPFKASACKYRAAPILPFSRCSENRSSFDPNYARYYPELRAAVETVPGVELLNTTHYFCDDYVCRMNRGDALLYRDAGHLNNVGSRFLVARMLADFPEFRASVTRP